MALKSFGADRKQKGSALSTYSPSIVCRGDGSLLGGLGQYDRGLSISSLTSCAPVHLYRVAELNAPHRRQWRIRGNRRDNIVRT